MKNKIMTKLTATVLAGTAIITAVGCNVTNAWADDSIPTSEMEISEDVEVIDDSEIIEDVDVIEDTEYVDSDAADEILANIAFENHAGFDIVNLYFANADESDWGEDILGEYILGNDEIINFDELFVYTADSSYYEILAVDCEGAEFHFEALNMAEAENPEDITIVFDYDEVAEVYTATLM